MPGFNWGGTSGGSSSGGGGVVTGGFNWGGGGSSSSAKKKPASSGGGFFGSHLLGEIGHAIGSHGGDTALSTAGSLGGDFWDTIHGTPGAAVGFGEAGLNLFRAPAFRASGGGGFQVGPSKGETVQDILKKTEQQYGYQYGPLFHGHVGEFGHRFQEHPLGPILDAATVLSLGGTGALRLARLGTLGDRAAELANSSRLLKSGSHVEELRASRTLQGRARQAMFDRWSMEHPNVPVFGADYRIKKILDWRIGREMLRARVPVRKFQRVTQALTPDERFAFHVAAEGVPLDERIAAYSQRLADVPSRTLRRYLNTLQKPGVRDALDNPRPEFITALEQGKALEAKAGEALVQTDQMTEQGRAERAVRPQEQLGAPSIDGPQPPTGIVEAKTILDPEGANAQTIEFRPSEPITYTRDGRLVSTTQYTDFGTLTHWDQHGYFSGIRVPPELRFNRRLLSDLREQMLYQMNKAGLQRIDPDPFGMSQDGIRLWQGMARRIRQGKVPEWKVVGDLQKGESKVGEMGRADLYDVAGQHFERVAEPSQRAVNRVNPAFPDPFRFRHVSGGKGLAGAIRPPKTEQMLGKAPRLDQLRYDSGKRLLDATFQTDPERVLSTDYLQTLKNQHIVQMQREALDKIAQPLDGQLSHQGFKGQDEFYYRPSYNRKATAPVDKATREAQALTHDLTPVTAEGERQAARKASGGIVSQRLNDLLAPGELGAGEAKNLARLEQLGIKRVPAAYGKAFHQEFAGTAFAVRALIDRPLDVWRAITLNFRPAWVVNNFVGNAVMGFATYGPAGAAAYLRVLLKTERGEQKVRKLWRWTLKHPTVRRSYGQVFQDVAPDLHSAGLFGTQTKITHAGVYEGRMARFAANPAVKALGFVPKKLGHGVLAVGRGVTKVEVLLAEDTGREAAFLREAGADLNKIRATAKKMDGTNLSIADALRKLDRTSIEKAVHGVNDALGDFNDLNHTERAFIRRAVPFYSWFKVITKVSGKYVARYPARIKMLQLIEQAKDTSGETPLPSWLRGSIRIGKPSHGVQTLLSTQGLNPYETIPQLVDAGPFGAANPFITSAVIGGTGRNPAFGTLQDYYGAGATNRSGYPGFAERYAGSLFGGLAPTRLYATQSEPYQGKLYAPHTYHAGPVPINDFLLQYLGIPLRHVKVAEAKRESGL